MKTLCRDHIKEIKIFLSLFILLIYLLLAFKNPYSARSLVPNLEPYPDTLYYSNPAWNFVKGDGFVMQAFDFQGKIITPPLYSLYLMPFFAVFNDVRAFYFANIILGIGSVLLFLNIAYKLFYKKPEDVLIVGIAGFLFVTNFYIYTLPSLLMAENLTMFITMVMLYLLIAPPTFRKAITAGYLGILMSLIKFSNVPFTGTFYVLYGALLITKKDKKILKTFLVSTVTAVIVFMTYIFTSKILEGHKNLSPGIGFAIEHFPKNLPGYFTTLFGGEDRYLWFTNRMVTPLISLVSLLGILVGMYEKHSKKTTIHLLLFGLSGVIFMSFFYLRDIRYVLPLFPVMVLLAGMAFSYLKQRTSGKIFLPILLLLLMTYLLVPQFGYIRGERLLISLKKQIGINFKHAEQPWNYNAVLVFNEYFDTSNTGIEKPYMATFLPPYFVNYFANGNYNYLPISMNQEFFGEKKGSSQTYTTSLANFYKDLLKDGKTIFISPYYQSNLRQWEADYARLTSEFTLELVHEGCFDTCNIYKVTPRE